MILILSSGAAAVFEIAPAMPPNKQSLKNSSTLHAKLSRSILSNEIVCITFCSVLFEGSLSRSCHKSQLWRKITCTEQHAVL